jgi:hemerythrin-like domain-containing protein
MAITLGAPPDSGFDDPFGLLSDCHRRIERFMGVLESIAQRSGSGRLTPEEADAVVRVLRYFRDAAPKHTQDEEESVFPRIFACKDPKARTVLLQVRELERDHGDASAWHAELDTLGRRWVDGAIDEAQFERLRDLVGLLQRLYREHIDVEDRQVFPAARMLLSDRDVEEIGREMARRRGLEHDGTTRATWQPA